MRNLSLWDVSVKELPIDFKGKLCMCYGHDEENVGQLYVCDSNHILRCFGEDAEEKWHEDLNHVIYSEDKAVNITYLSLPSKVCVGSESGELMAIGDCGTHGEMVGVVDAGIRAMEWSPDQELFTIVTKENSMFLMSCTFDCIHECSLISQEFGERQFITVGWGKKETQFHGKEGKEARVKTDVEPDHQITDNTVKISWRGDGQLYAVGFTMDGVRRFKVFDREGHLQFTSEKQPGLEANLAWRPSGNVIATTQRLPDKYVVAFFEKNGLKHGEFNIPASPTTVVEDITWSNDSEILMLQCKDTESSNQSLLLFTASNYHWYLKQTLGFNEGINTTLWDNDFDVINNKKLHVILNNGKHISYTWIWNIDHSQGKSADDDAVVTVVDGTKLLLTGFRQTVVPPPMAALEIQLESPVNSVHFAPENVCSNTFFAITSDQKLIVYEQTQKFPLQYKEKTTVILEKHDFPLQYYNWRWLDQQTILCVTVDDENVHNIVEYNFDSDIFVRELTWILPAPVLRIEPHPVDKSIAFLQLNTGEIMCYETGDLEHLEVAFGIPCAKFSVLYINGTLRFIGLSQKGGLYLDNSMIMNNVSSFFIHTHFVLLTTLQHVLLCTELNDLGLNGLMYYAKNESENVYKRKIERGAKLVIAVANDTRAVFQMPRGNLETIQPRPLSLKIIGEFLDSLKYNEAFDLMRKQRINLNLIYDHNPDKFTENISVFLDSVNNNSWLSLFLSDLENVDVTKTMYSSSYADSKIQQEDIGNKIRRICELVRSNLSLQQDTDHRILPFLTSFVKTNTAEDLESALSLIKDLKTRESAGEKLPVTSDEALKYLLYMVDVTNLFDVALGMYDFELVLLIANKSQKDPKEFIPMLNEFNEMDERYRRFAINKHLKRFEKAVRCLVECGPDKYEELRTFVKYHSLYKEALPLFPQTEEVYKQISEDYGLYLRLKKQFIEAGIVFERGGNYDKAIECYKDALEWELAVNLAMKWPKEQFQELCVDLVNSLKEERRHREALAILEQHYEDKEEAIRYAIESGQYKTAITLCTRFQKQELKEANLLPALEEEHRNLVELIQTNYTTFIRHRDRLQLVRENKRQHPMEYDPGYGNRDSDLYSDAGSTVASSRGSSNRSYRSSKNRRKHERKVASLKEGSQYEDVALVMALHNLVTSSFDLRPQAKEVVIALCCFGNDKEAFVLQASLDKLLCAMKDSLRDIWTTEFMLEATTAAAAVTIDGVATLQGIASLDPHLRIAPVIQELNWKLDGLF